MISYVRQQEIMNYLKEKQFATVGELAAAVYASESSVRRDISELEKRGCACRVYGGVVLPGVCEQRHAREPARRVTFRGEKRAREEGGGLLSRTGTRSLWMGRPRYEGS